MGKLRPDWAGGKSDKGAVLELLAFFREGQVGRACEWAYDRLVAGKLQAATVWDAIFLASAELIVRYEVGSVTGRPLHSMTMANALHYAFRTCSEPETRLRILLEAIHWGCDFYAVERGRGNLRDLRITAIPEVGFARRRDRRGRRHLRPTAPAPGPDAGPHRRRQGHGADLRAGPQARRTARSSRPPAG